MGVAQLLTDTVSVETCTGQDPSPTYAPAASIACMAQKRQEVARDPSGYMAASSMVLYTPSGSAAKFPWGTRVTVNGHVGYVIASYPFEHGPASAWHVKVLVS